MAPTVVGGALVNVGAIDTSAFVARVASARETTVRVGASRVDGAACRANGALINVDTGGRRTLVVDAVVVRGIAAPAVVDQALGDVCAGYPVPFVARVARAVPTTVVVGTRGIAVAIVGVGGAFIDIDAAGPCCRRVHRRVGVWIPRRVFPSRIAFAAKTAVGIGAGGVGIAIVQRLISALVDVQAFARIRLSGCIPDERTAITGHTSTARHVLPIGRAIGQRTGRPITRVPVVARATETAFAVGTRGVGIAEAGLAAAFINIVIARAAVPTRITGGNAHAALAHHGAVHHAARRGAIATVIA